MNPGVPTRPGDQPLHDGNMTVEQLRRLVEIQTEVVKQAEQVKLAQQHRRTNALKLAAAPRRLLSFLSQLW
ncbi:MAG TPA: hypothetical protein VFV96_03145 [Verrucomicrobiae bacterium]|nr:hypothetical protein [Verrucomicrobiae bacterium]